MRVLLGFLMVLGITVADTKIPITQIKATAAANSVSLLMVSADATGKVSIQQVNLGAGLTIAPVTGGFELRVVVPAQPPTTTPAVTTYTNVKTRQLSDGTWTPITALTGKVVVTTLEVHRNGVLQDDSDYSFDTSNNSIKMLVPYDQTSDKIVLSVTTTAN